MRRGENSLHIGPSFRSSRIETLYAGKYSFKATVLDIRSSHVLKLGINPEVYEPGLKVYFMPWRTFADYCKKSGLGGAGKIEALYSVPGGSVVKETTEGARNKLPASARRIVAPLEYKERYLAHEVLHDIFLGCLDKKTREEFYGFIATILDRVMLGGFSKDERLFFNGVNKRMHREIPLNEMTEDDLMSIALNGRSSTGFKVFAGECFAYAGEILLFGPDRASLGKVPDEIAEIMRRWILV